MSRRQQRSFKVWVFSWLVAVCLALLIGEGLSHLVEIREYAHFLILANQPNQTIVLSEAATLIELRTPNERARFIMIISGAGDASFGRSHPIGLLKVRIEGRNEHYLLGNDAYHPNGFWLLRDFGVGESQLCVLKRFYSAGLTEWLKSKQLSG